MPELIKPARRADASPPGEDETTGARPSRRPKGLLRAWLIASLCWVVLAGLNSVAPIRGAVAYARTHHAVTIRPAPGEASGPLSDPPDTPTVAAIKVVARQGAFILAPPFLLLWFGWDAWFAVVGFLELRRRGGEGSGR